MEDTIDLVTRLVGADAKLRYRVRPAGFNGELLVVDIDDADGLRLLLSLDAGGRPILQSAMSRREPHKLVSRYEQLIAAATLIAPRRERVLLLGLGGGAFWRHLRRAHPGSAVRIVENLPEVLSIARQWFDVDGASIIVADAASHLRESTATYELIVVDLYDATGLAALPEAFWAACEARLGADGALVVNWADFAGNDSGRAAAEALARRFADTRYLIAATRENNCIQLCARNALPSPEALREGIPGPAALGGRRIALDKVLVSRDWPRLPGA